MKFTMTMLVTLLALLLSSLVRSALCSNSSSQCCTASQRCTPWHPHNGTSLKLPKVLVQTADLGKIAQARWNYTMDSNEDRTPQHIQNATCLRCVDEGLKAVPIQYEIDLIHRIKCGVKKITCKCPCRVNVGCTCVRE